KLLVKSGLGIFAHVYRRQTILPHLFETFHHVADLRLDHDDNGIVREGGIRSEYHKEIWKAADRDAVIAANAAAPDITKPRCVSAGYRKRAQRSGDLESGRVDDGIDAPLVSVARDDAVRPNFRYRRRRHCNVRAGEGGIVVIGNKNAFAAHAVMWSHSFAQVGVLDGACDTSTDHIFIPAQQQVVSEKHKQPHFMPPK